MKLPLNGSTTLSTKLPSEQYSVVHVVNGGIKLDSTKIEQAQYYGGTAFNPTKLMLLRAINKNHFIPWSAITPKLIRKHLPTRVATAQGHLDQ